MNTLPNSYCYFCILKQFFNQGSSDFIILMTNYKWTTWYFFFKKFSEKPRSKIICLKHEMVMTFMLCQFIIFCVKSGLIVDYSYIQRCSQKIVSCHGEALWSVSFYCHLFGNWKLKISMNNVTFPVALMHTQIY